MVLDQRSWDDSQIDHKAFRRSLFGCSTFKKARLTDCAFYHCRFSDCYFKNASFSRVQFIDCLFENCDFDGASFENCKLEYSEFDRCKIEYRQIQDCLPGWQNVLLRLARSLRKNAEAMGDPIEYRKFLRLELQASETHFKFMFTKFDGYYGKYRFIDRVRALKTWVGMKMDKILWGYGERWTRIVFSAAVAILIFALAFMYTGAQIKNMPEGATFWNFLAFSASNFLTIAYENAAPSNGWGRFLVISEAALGLLVFGFLVTALYLRVSKR